MDEGKKVMIRMVKKVKEQQKTMRVPMKEKQRKKQQKRDTAKEKSGPIPYKQNTLKDLVTKGSYDSYNNEP